ncbi:MAG: sugar ABC transporter substrate-binding protein [Epulopiscium sp. Nele67-Bin001]|nr:MAG: sugar ABC transporter substrate-binding protein [Epulopiscium sp. Nuni2H_MBin001]OON92102.1 MAG: sugar ABC transporter substrate-binding protein [Epulopiscium sp. Nele67-Bin001]
MKKFSKILLGLGIVVLSAGCSDNPSASQSTTPNTNTEAPTNTTPQTSSDTSIQVEEPKFAAEITEPVEVIFWHAMNGTLQDTLTELTAQFMEENPNVKITLQNQSSYGDLNQKISASLISTSTLPTMTQAYLDWMYYPIQDNLILDLMPFVTHDVIGIDNFNDIDERFLEPLISDNKLYGIPFNKSSEVLWYNKTMFEELNLNPPTNYQEFEQVAKTIYEEKGIAGAGFDSLSSYYVTYLENLGITFDKDIDPTTEFSISAAQYYLNGIQEGYFRIAGTDFYLSGPLGSELVGMYVGSNAGESFVLQAAEGKFEVGVAPYPANLAIQQGTDLFVFSTASDEQQRAAYEYLKFLTDTDTQIKWAINTGYLPIRETAFTSEEYKTSGAMIPTIAEDMVDKLYNKPAIGGSAATFTEAASVMETILATPGVDVEKTMKNFQSTLNSLWE